MSHGLAAALTDVRPGDLVFARLGSANAKAGASLWPALVLETTTKEVSPRSCTSARTRTSATLFFFGDAKSAELDVSRLYDYDATLETELVRHHVEMKATFALAVNEATALRAERLVASDARTSPALSAKSEHSTAAALPLGPLEAAITLLHPAHQLRAHEIVFVNLSAATVSAMKAAIWPATVVADGEGRVDCAEGCYVEVECFGDLKRTHVARRQIFPYEPNYDSALVCRRRKASSRFEQAMADCELEHAAQRVQQLTEASVRPLSGEKRGSAAELTHHPAKVKRIWRLARISAVAERSAAGDDASSEDDEEISEAAFARRHAPFALLEKAGFSTV
ncbi:hypothetical protein T492DRAFT_1133129 [Pavlovales sp. CCMP2436]|nr:hypothetical protein T492DRAFT_1133129 [Pavlovales sp. CCMP2436]